MEEELVLDEEALWQQHFTAACTLLDQGNEAAAVRQLALLCSVGLRQGQLVQAQQCWGKLLSLTEPQDGLVYLQQLKGLLSLTARMRQDQLFASWLLQAEPVFYCGLAQGGQQQVLQVLLDLVFVACDRRYIAVLPRLRLWLGLAWQHIRTRELQEFLLRELLTMLAQLSRRKWPELNHFFCRVIFENLLRRGDVSLMGSCLLQLQLHLQTYGRQDGLEEAFSAYEDVQYFYLLLFKRGLRKSLPEERRLAYLQVLSRSLRDLCANLARTVLEDDLYAIRRWQEFLEGQVSPGLRSQARLLVQFVIGYWYLTKPRTGKKQIDYVKDLLEPSLLTEEQNALLEKIV